MEEVNIKASGLAGFIANWGVKAIARSLDSILFAHACDLIDQRDGEIANPCDVCNDLFVLRELRNAIWELRNEKIV